MGHLVGRGALLSTLLVIFLLPVLLVLSDKLVMNQMRRRALRKAKRSIRWKTWLEKHKRKNYSPDTAQQNSKGGLLS